MRNKRLVLLFLLLTMVCCTNHYPLKLQSEKMIETYKKLLYNAKKDYDEDLKTGLDSLLNTPFYMTFIMYSWEDTTRVTIWGHSKNHKYPLVKEEEVRSHTYCGVDEIFIEEYSHDFDSTAIISILDGLTILEKPNIEYRCWCGEPYTIDYAFVNGEWSLSTYGYNDPGLWLKARLKDRDAEAVDNLQ